MSIIKKQSSLDNEVVSVFEDKRLFVMPKIKVSIHTDEDDLEADLVNNIRISRNFNVNLTDIIYAEFMIPSGTFQKRLYPKRENLEISLIFNYDNKAMRVLRYKFILITKLKDNDTSQSNKLDEGELDTQDLVTVKGQCVDKLTLNLKNKYVSGIYHNYDLKYFLKSLLGYELNSLNINYKINIYDLDNTNVYKNILIPPLTKLIKLPYFLQNDLFGLYNNNANIYFTKIRYGGEYKNMLPPPTDEPEFLFGTGEDYDIEIFPIHDYNRFDAESKRHKLLFISPSIKELGINEYDFYYRDGVYKIIAHDVSFKTETEDKKYDMGTTIADTEPDLFRDTATYDITNDQIFFQDQKTNKLETLSDKPATYDSVLDVSNDYNVYKYRSLINRGEGIIGIVKIGSINPDFIYPGMPFKYIFSKDGLNKETTGIVQSVEYFYDIANKTIMGAIIGMFKKIKEN